MICPLCFNAKVGARVYYGGFEQVDVASWSEVMAFEVEDGVCDELAGAMESCLAAAEGFFEFCLA